ncbi:AAA family ATPase [Gandjariella thermophila]|uniref:ATPase AAA n=1 Tax=Gandjariella thermophila TaxID=1931992 RepID=A0A4D4J5L1_9PSEU|nr:MoxR family ATPase [Gandjariella thermophila]GDY29879.1 ATPase AAA [Gandjariella thermophila]
MEDWWIYRGTGEPHPGILRLPAPPPWRVFDGGPPVAPHEGSDAAVPRRLGDARRAVTYRPRREEVELVNAALYLRRPLLVTGKPGTGKSTLAYSVAHELALGPVLRWPITSRATLQQGLYEYDAIGRLHEANLSEHTGGGARDLGIGRYLTLGPLGTALLPYEQPRVLLIDEIDKSDIDLPNDLLNIFEEGEYSIPELRRVSSAHPRVEVQTADGGQVVVERGHVRCRAFPFVVLTSNGEREFPPAFLRRCLRLDLHEPDADQLASIVEAHLGPGAKTASDDLIERFIGHRERGTLATDQLLNAIYLTSTAAVERGLGREELADMILRYVESDAGLG